MWFFSFFIAFLFTLYFLYSLFLLLVCLGGSSSSELVSDVDGLLGRRRLDVSSFSASSLRMSAVVQRAFLHVCR